MIAIRVDSITKSFAAVQALKGPSFDFSSGLMHGIIGPEGAGKTTLLRLIMALLRPTKGEISYRDDDRVLSFETIKEGMAYMPQQQSLYADLSIEEHLRFFGDLYGLEHDVYAERTERLLAITRLAPFRTRSAGHLSGGMYKKLGLMCALLRSPRVLLLDEPTNGVDPISRREFWELLHDLRREGILIILTTSYMDEAERCDVAHLMQEGELLVAGRPRVLLEAHSVSSVQELFIQQTSRRDHA